MSEQDEQDQQIRTNADDLDTLWSRMKYLGRTDYIIQWKGDTPGVHWLGLKLGSVSELNQMTIDALAARLDKAKRIARKRQQS